jgi:uncharacterized OB-fold protein
MSERFPRPVPRPDGRSAPYWEAASRHVLTAARCSRCRAFAHPPEAVCPHCGSTDPDFTFEPLDGRGVVRSWTVMRQPSLPGFVADVPFVLVDVELIDQPRLRLIGRLMDGPDAPLHVGDAVRVAFEAAGDDVSVPSFELEAPR